MNKITKANFKKLVLVLTLTLVMTLGMSISVFAATGAINNEHYSHCSVEFSAPSNCHSVKIVSSHKVSAFGQIWSTKTSATC